MKGDFKGLDDLNAFEFVELVLDCVDVVSARRIFAWKVYKDSNMEKPKARAMSLHRWRPVLNVGSYRCRE